MNPKFILAAVGLSLSIFIQSSAAESFIYAMPDGNSGLRIAWRNDSSMAWNPVGIDLVKNDFGPWGSHKKMYAPRLFLNGADGRWTAVWNATAEGDVVALTSTDDFKVWSPQIYLASALDLPRDMYPVSGLYPDSAFVENTSVAGWRIDMPDNTLEQIRSVAREKIADEALFAEVAKDDPVRFDGLKAPVVHLSPDPERAKPISDMLVGIFFEDINYAADGGLYAELIQNRDFEYSPDDRKGDLTWNARTAWETVGIGEFGIDTVAPLHENNRHYASLYAAQDGFAIVNNGFDGISLRKDETYNLSFFARTPKPLKAIVSVGDDRGKIIASKKVNIASDGWKQYSLRLKADASCSAGRLKIALDSHGAVDIDMVSLFPEKTFKNRRNGLRADLAQTLADLKPRFIRFPGGCVAHGDGIDNIYDWKGSIGPLEARKPLRNLWGYHQTRGLGYHEYFLFCEDIGAEPVPVLAAGVPCQNSSAPSHHSSCTLNTLGQQCGIPMEEMKDYIQDVLDLIEYANGDVSTHWGALRAQSGHPSPFNLKYIGIGNEDLISDVFEARFRMIYDAVRAAHPEITVIGTVGPFYEGSDYEAGWKLARELDIPIVDEHYYVSPGWLIYNQDYYDSYPRDATKVYLGEYASHLPGRPSNIETALSEALYLTAVERNADVVSMTSYAPLLAKKGHTQWSPDLIYFDNDSVYHTVDYHVQKLFGNNSGDTYIPSVVSVDNQDAKVASRIGTSIVRDSQTGQYIIKMVNMLPVETLVEIDLAPLGISAAEHVAWQLAGMPDDNSAVPVEIDICLPSLSLPPYSFTVVRL